MPASPDFHGFTLYPFQEEAIQAVRRGSSVIVAAPTGAGKTLVADYAIEHTLEKGERIVYTAPVKALSNQKFRDFRDRYRDDVGIMTGDVTINPDASLLIMTTEVFRNTIFESPERLSRTVYAILDEVHYLDDPDRGTVWEESIIFAPEHVRFLCLSATVPNVRELANWIGEVRGERIAVVQSEERPVPLRHFAYAPGTNLVRLGEIRKKLGGKRRRSREGGVKHLLGILRKRDLLPCLYFCFSRKDCERLAKSSARSEWLGGAERKKILALFDDLKERYRLTDGPSTSRLRSLAARGCLYHHAGLLPIHKEIVERLFTSGLTRLLFTTETFALGVNMPARTVAFHMLKKFDGVAFGWLRTRDYYQMAGRAGRPGIDTLGHVVSKLDLRFDDPAEVVRIVRGKVEPVRSRFNLSYSALLSLYERLGEDGLVLAYERSFARYQRKRRASGRKKGRTPPEARVLRQRLAVLRRTGYLDENGLAEKGRFAVLVNGYEIQAAELMAHGVFHLADEVQLATLATSVVFEARKGDTSSRLDPAVLAEIRKLSEQKIRAFRRVEREEGLRNLTKEPDFRMAHPTFLWANGGSLEELHRVTSVSDGDLVRNLRMAIQLLRQIQGRIQDDPDLRNRFAKAIRLLNRDEVDAHRQLSLG